MHQREERVQGAGGMKGADKLHCGMWSELPMYVNGWGICETVKAGIGVKLR